MHHKANALAVCILIQRLNVKIRIRCNKVKDIVLGLAKPILPTYVPTLYKNLIKAVLCSKVDKTTNASVVCRVLWTLLNLCIVSYTELNCWNIVCICPVACTGNHLPPNTYILHWFNPRCILVCTRVVKIKNQL